MAKIIAGVGCSHVPAIGAALDLGKTEEPYWKRVFAGFEKSKRWIADIRPDVAIVVFNDHATSFSVEVIPTFALGCADHYKPADEGWGARPVPIVRGHPELASHIAQSVILDEFDLTIVNKMDVDHGLTVPLSLMFGKVNAWPCTVIPLAVNVVMYPPPTGRRCFALGRSIRKAVEAYHEDLRVVILGTGGLSHQISGPRAGLINSEWDRRFLDNLTADPLGLTRIPHLDYMREAGAEGIEMIMWLIMRGALSENVRKVHSSFYLPSMTSIATLVLENEAAELPDAEAVNDRHRARMAEQLAGVEEMTGTYPFDIARSVKGYRINKFLHDLVDPEHRARFLDEPETAFKEAGLTEEEQELIRSRDWPGMIHYGVIFFMLEKLAAVTGVSNLHVYAAMRGETLEDFLKTRNTQVIYSVAGKQEKQN